MDKNYIKSIWLERIEEVPVINGNKTIVRMERYTPDSAFLYIDGEVVKQILNPYYSSTELRYHTEQYLAGKGVSKCEWPNWRESISTYAVTTISNMIFYLSWSIAEKFSSVKLKLEYAGREIDDVGSLVGVEDLFNQIYIKWCSEYDKENNLKWKQQ